MKDKKHFLDHHRHDSSADTAASFHSSSSPPIYPAIHPNPPPPHHFSPSPTPIPTAELPRRCRGRPPGSKTKNKNKNKPPSSCSPLASPAPASLNLSGGPHPPPSMSTLLLRIDPDNDVINSIKRFCRSKSVSLSILSTSGALSHITLAHPSPPPPNLAFFGMFEILSISGTIISESAGPSESRSNHPPFYLPSRFTVTVSSPRGHVITGSVGGPLIAARPVFVVAASLDKPSYHRLPEMNEHEDGNERQQTTGGSDAVWGPAVARLPYRAL